jgi:hypothetical protein
VEARLSIKRTPFIADEWRKRKEMQPLFNAKAITLQGNVDDFTLQSDSFFLASCCVDDNKHSTSRL